MDARDLWHRIVARVQRGARVTRSRHPTWLLQRRRAPHACRAPWLAVALVGGTLLTLALVPADDRRFLPAANVGIVVLDVSTSVKPSTYDLIREQLAGCRPRLAGSASSCSPTSPRGAAARDARARAASSSASSSRSSATTRTAMPSRARRGSSGSRPARRSPPACCSPHSCSSSVRTRPRGRPDQRPRGRPERLPEARRHDRALLAALDPAQRRGTGSHTGRPRVLPRAPRQPRRDQQRPAADGADRARQPRDRVRLPVDDASSPRSSSRSWRPACTGPSRSSGGGAGMTRLVAGVGCLALSCLALLRRDVWHADDALRDADLRGSVQPLSARSWRAARRSRSEPRERLSASTTTSSTGLSSRGRSR